MHFRRFPGGCQEVSDRMSQNTCLLDTLHVMRHPGGITDGPVGHVCSPQAHA